MAKEAAAKHVTRTHGEASEAYKKALEDVTGAAGKAKVNALLGEVIPGHAVVETGVFDAAFGKAGEHFKTEARKLAEGLEKAAKSDVKGASRFGKETSLRWTERATAATGKKASKLAMAAGSAVSLGAVAYAGWDIGARHENSETGQMEHRSLARMGLDVLVAAAGTLGLLQSLRGHVR